MDWLCGPFVCLQLCPHSTNAHPPTPAGTARGGRGLLSLSRAPPTSITNLVPTRMSISTTTTSLSTRTHTHTHTHTRAHTHGHTHTHAHSHTYKTHTHTLATGVTRGGCNRCGARARSTAHAGAGGPRGGAGGRPGCCASDRQGPGAGCACCGVEIAVAPAAVRQIGRGKVRGTATQQQGLSVSASSRITLPQLHPCCTANSAAPPPLNPPLSSMARPRTWRPRALHLRPRSSRTWTPSGRRTRAAWTSSTARAGRCGWRHSDGFPPLQQQQPYNQL